KTSRNANGTYTTTITSGPINYRDHQGRWQPIDSTLVAAGNSGYAWSNRANAFSVSFKQELTQDYLRIDARGKTFALSLDGAGSARAAVRCSRVAYARAFLGVGLCYGVWVVGVMEALLLANLVGAAI